MSSSDVERLSKWITKQITELELDADDASLLILMCLPGATMRLVGDTCNFTATSNSSHIYALGKLNKNRSRFISFRITVQEPEEFAQRMTDLLSDFRTKAKNRISRLMYSRLPLKGYINCEDHFSLYPVHQWASISNLDPYQGVKQQRLLKSDETEYGPPFPVYIEVESSVSRDHPFYLRGGMRNLDRYQNIVAVLFRDLFPVNESRQPRQWSMFGQTSPSGLEIYYGLATQGFSTEEDATFSRYLSEGGRPAPEYVGCEDYYDSISVGEESRTPPNLNEMLEKYANLDSKVAADFDRAAYLFSQAEHIRNSGYDSLVSYASAIECLIDKKGERCSSCGQSKYSVSRKFRNFLDKYAPADSMTTSAEFLYQSRSNVAHGKLVRRVDSIGKLLSKIDISEVIFPIIVRKALANWLIASGR